MADKQYGMLIKTKRCVGCQTCVVGCKIYHELPNGIYLGYLETVGAEHDYVVSGTYPNVSITFRPHLCNHCESPVCAEQCPTGAMHKRDEDGIVESDSDVCIGCGTCVQACPYGAPVLDTNKNKAAKCDLCRSRIENDELPFCVRSCPAEARLFGDINDPNSNIAKEITATNAKPYLPENGTNPSVFYC